MINKLTLILTNASNVKDKFQFLGKPTKWGQYQIYVRIAKEST